ncbi:hypothetical protein [Hespellia stercorisuis]|nr:hypothetical protein [Hespellia stercorisuis]
MNLPIDVTQSDLCITKDVRDAITICGILLVIMSSTVGFMT